MADRPLHTGDDLLAEKHVTRITALFADEQNVGVEATWASASA